MSYPCFHLVAEENFRDFIQLTDHLRGGMTGPNKHIVKQGEEADEAYVIVDGECEVEASFVYRRNEKEKIKTKKLCILKNHDMFGELALLFKNKRTATVTTTEHTQYLRIPAFAMRKYMA